MTLIAMIEDGKSTSFISDVLLTRPKMPALGAANAFPGLSSLPTPDNVHVAGLVQKMVSLNDRTLFLWADSLNIAREATTRLRVLMEQTQVDWEKVKSILHEYRVADFSFMFCYARKTGKLVKLTWNCDQIDIPDFGLVTIAGSGAGGFLSLVAADVDGDYGPASVSSKTYNAIQKVMYLDVKFAALSGRQSNHISQGWGGVIETAILREHGLLTKFGRSIYVHSWLSQVESKYKLDFAPYIVITRYINDSFAGSEIELFNNQFRYFVVQPPDRRGIKLITSYDEFSPANSAYGRCCHCIHLNFGPNYPSMVSLDASEIEIRPIFEAARSGDQEACLTLYEQAREKVRRAALNMLKLDFEP